MITSKDYSAQAYYKLILAAKKIKEYGWIQDSKTLLYVAEKIDDSIHFNLPDGGSIIHDNLKGIIDQDIRLPFPRITLSFEDTLNNSKRVIIAEEISREEALRFDPYRDKIDNPSDMFLRITPILPNGTFGWLPDFYVNNNPCRDWGSKDNKSRNMIYAILQPLIIPNIIEEFKKMIGTSLDIEEGSKAIALDSTIITLDFLEALSCTNVAYEPIRKITNIDRQKRKKISKIPLYEVNVLTIKAPINKKLSNNTLTGITKNSPREHLRRGHIRRLDETRKIWVNSCIVNAGSINGKINKTYNVIK